MWLVKPWKHLLHECGSSSSIKLVWLCSYEVVYDAVQLTLYTLISVSIFSILFSIRFFCHWQGEFIWKSKLRKLAIIFYFLMILMNCLAVLLYGEIRCWALLGFKGLSFICFHQDNFYSLQPLCWWLDTIMNENFMRKLIFYYNLTHTIFQNEISNNLG